MRKLLVKKIVSFIFIFIATGVVMGQDFHFSQFDASPLMVNPGNTGMFRGKLRSFVNYKEQWRSIHTPFLTYAVSSDMTILRKSNNANLGLGLLVLKDQAGEINLSKTSFNLSVSGIVKLDNTNVLSLGIQSGFVQNSFDLSALRWGNQFDGTGYNASIDPNEDFASESFLTPDFAVGLVYSYNDYQQQFFTNEELIFSTGLAMFHVARPKTSTAATDKTHRRYNFFIDGIYTLKESKSSIQGTYMLQKQGPSYENLIGIFWRYNLNHGSHFTRERKNADLKIGSYYRWNDAISPYVGFDMNGFGIGISYDVNVSGLRVASGGNGGIEVNLKFILGASGKASVNTVR